MKKKSLLLFTTIFLFLFTSCQGFFGNNKTGLTIRLPGEKYSRTLGNDGETLYFTILCEKDDGSFSIPQEGESGDELIFEDLTPGKYTISGEAYSDEEKTILKYTGQVGAVVTSGVNTPVHLVLSLVDGGSGSGGSGDEEEIITSIVFSEYEVSFGLDCFENLSFIITYNDSTTEEKTLEQLINEDFRVTFAEQEINAEILSNTTNRNNFKTKIAGKVPVTIEKGSYNFEGNAHIYFDSITLGYSCSGGGGSDILETTINEEELSSLEVSPIHFALVEYDEINNKNINAYYDFFNEFNENIDIYKEDGTCVPGVNIGSNITVSWEVQFNDDASTKVQSTNRTFDFATEINLSNIDFPVQISCTVSSVYFDEDLSVKYKINEGGSIDLWY